MKEQALDFMMTHACAFKLAQEGLHELTITPDQALGMADMKFNLTTTEFEMPVDSMVVHIPRELYKLPRFGDELHAMKEFLMHGIPVSNTPASLYDKIYKEAVNFAKHGDAISILVQKFKGPQNAIAMRMLMGGAHTHMVLNDMSTRKDEPVSNTIEDCFKYSKIDAERTATIAEQPKLINDLFRIALSSVLISTLKPSLCIPRELSSGVMKERSRFLEKIKETIKIEEMRYFIFQPNMKTYVEKTEGDAVLDRGSPSTFTLRPVFVSGHWRRQPHGPQRSLRRLQWIKALIRNKRLLVGESAPIVTSAVLTQPNEVVKDCIESTR
jgi:hypothetical protein